MWIPTPKNCRVAECTPLAQPHYRTRLFSNAGSGRSSEIILFSWWIARGKAQPLHRKRMHFLKILMTWREGIPGFIALPTTLCYYFYCYYLNDTSFLENSLFWEHFLKRLFENSLIQTTWGGSLITLLEHSLISASRRHQWQIPLTNSYASHHLDESATP